MTQEVREATLAAAADIPGQEIDMPPPPGGCYMKLLHTIEDAAYSGKTIFGVPGITYLLIKVFTFYMCYKKLTLNDNKQFNFRRLRGISDVTTDQ